MPYGEASQANTRVWGLLNRRGGRAQRRSRQSRSSGLPRAGGSFTSATSSANDLVVGAAGESRSRMSWYMAGPHTVRKMERIFSSLSIPLAMK